MDLFCKKKGELTFTLQKLIDIVLGIMILIGLLSFLVITILAFSFKEPNLEEKDFNRVLAEINSLKIGSDSIMIPIFSENIAFQLLKTEKAMYDCDKNSICLCYFIDDIHSPKECRSSILDFKEFKAVASSSSNRDIKPENKKIALKIKGNEISLEKDLSAS